MTRRSLVGALGAIPALLSWTVNIETNAEGGPLMEGRKQPVAPNNLRGLAALKKQGALRVPSAPGLGVEVDERQVHHASQG